MGDISPILNKIEAGDLSVTGHLLPLVFEELRS